MKITMKRLAICAALTTALAASSCENDAYIASRNLSVAADQFEIQRRVVFYNGITGEYMLSIEGRCSIAPVSGRLEVTCRTGRDEYVKHFLGLSDNVTYFAEQLEVADVSVFHTRIVFKPQSIIADVDFIGSAAELTTDRNEGAEGNQ